MNLITGDLVDCILSVRAGGIVDGDKRFGISMAVLEFLTGPTGTRLISLDLITRSNRFRLSPNLRLLLPRLRGLEDFALDRNALGLDSNLHWVGSIRSWVVGLVEPGRWDRHHRLSE